MSNLTAKLPFKTDAVSILLFVASVVAVVVLVRKLPIPAKIKP